ncbi:MAG: hypothetical protein MJ108_07580 [Saccharofermentans sp.]|nr:hypothetical protein [Saccharofermentans sp.]
MKKVIIATMILVTAIASAASMAYMVSKYEDKCNDAKKITISYEGVVYRQPETTVQTEVVEKTEAAVEESVSKPAQKAPVQTAAPVETAPAPVETEVVPVETEPAPVETQPDPVETQPQPVSNYVVCPICNGMGVVYEQSQYYDALLGWQFVTYTYCCGGCGGSGCI